MWEYTSTDELYHHGVLGMRWGHRKTKAVSFVKAAFEMDVDDVKNEIKSLKRLKSQTSNERKKILQDRAKKYGYKTASTINTAKHISNAIGNAYVAKYLKDYGMKTIRSYGDISDIANWRKVAAYTMIAVPVSMFALATVNELSSIDKENKIQKNVITKNKRR